MDIIELKERNSILEGVKTNRIYLKLQKLLNYLKKKELPHKIIESINQEIEELNSTSFTGKELSKIINKKYTLIIKLLEKELKIVPKNYYQNLWQTLGMATFGIPIGVILWLRMDNVVFLPLGLPIGMGIGIVLGLVIDYKAYKKGRQLDIDEDHLL